MVLGKSSKIAFIGTGIMGAPIAEHILDAGYDVTVYTRTRSKAEGLLAKGAHWADGVVNAVTDADVIFTMVGYPSDVEDVYLSSDGILRASKRGAWMIDLTTSSPQLARDIHDAAEIDDKHAIDCPVTGGEAGAKSGTLTLIAGAKEKDIEPIRALLETFSAKIYCMGKAGMGQIAKLCNQISLASCMIGYADAMALAQQGGLDVKQTLEMIASGMGSSRALQELAPKSLEGDFTPGFLAEHFRKDIALALAQSEDLDITLPGTETAFALFDMLCQVGGSRMGTQALTLLYSDEQTGTAAGIDWSLLDSEEEECSHHHEDHDCCGNHRHEDGDCCGGNHHHEGHDCCGGHHHDSHEHTCDHHHKH